MTSQRPDSRASPPKAWRPPFACLSCKRPFPETGFPHCCPQCGGLFDFTEPLAYRPEGGASDGAVGLGRYQRTFPLPPGTPWLGLGEGGSPLVTAVIDGRRVHFKCEFTNPTGSFKDRGSAVLAHALQAAGVSEVVEDSSGNAGASIAAYAARLGIRARVFVPDSASPTKLAQIQAYGAQVVRVMGPRSNAAKAVQAEVAAGAVYASHAHLPHVLAGMATIAFELCQDLGGPPGSLIVPVGQGSLLLGLSRGFEALKAAAALEVMPRLIGVQARACAPIWAVAHGGAAPLSWVGEGETAAEGIRIRNPLRGDSVLAAVEASRGWMDAVEESEISDARSALARLGFWIEPTSAVVWPALRRGGERLVEPVVAVLTGSGYKHLQS